MLQCKMHVQVYELTGRKKILDCKKVILSIPTKLKQAPKDFEKKYISRSVITIIYLYNHKCIYTF